MINHNQVPFAGSEKARLPEIPEKQSSRHSEEGVVAQGFFVARILTIIAAFIGFMPTAIAEPAREDLVIVAVAYNVARFSTWPPNAYEATSTFNFCITEKNRMIPAFQSLNGRMIADRIISVRIVLSNEDSFEGCHVVYFPGEAGDEEIAADLLNQHVLTVSGKTGFASSQGVVEISLVGRKPSFAININNASAAGITPSSKVLELAREVIK